jgi:16S rRNA (uracil1498-N3)-methyltransferase
VERWRRIARESSEQSRRLKAPEVADPVRFSAALAGEAGLRVWLDEQAGAKPLIEVATAVAPCPAALLIGPEGGWAPAERTQMDAAGWQGASLGPAVLRAETAVCAALAVILQAHHTAWSH